MRDRIRPSIELQKKAYKQISAIAYNDANPTLLKKMKRYYGCSFFTYLKMLREGTMGMAMFIGFCENAGLEPKIEIKELV